jgi:transposase
MPHTRQPYSKKFRDRIIELARNGRTPKDLAEEFEPTQTTIRNWIKKADRDEEKALKVFPSMGGKNFASCARNCAS